MKNNNRVLIAIIAVVVGAVAFFGGMKYQQSKTPAFGNRQFQQGANGGRQGVNGQNRFAGGRPVMGEVLSIDATSMTVKMQDGSSKIVLLPDTVTVSKTDAGTKSDLQIGSKVGVFGAENSDGSVTAQDVQLNPMFRTMQGAPSASAK